MQAERQIGDVPSGIEQEAGVVDRDRIQGFVNDVWDDSIIPSLAEYIRIPNKSPLFDASWQSAGHMDKAVKLIETWCKAQEIDGATIEGTIHEGAAAAEATGRFALRFSR